MISIKSLAANYGSKILFTEVDLYLNSGRRYGLVGGNGAGKSTFLRLLAGEEEIPYGEIDIAKKTKIGLLRQDRLLRLERNSIDSTIEGNKILSAALDEKASILSKGEISDEDGYRLGELEQIIMDEGGYEAETFATELLKGLGIKEESLYKPISELSDGFRLRLLLAQSLFNDPDVLLLDEPTNYLDIVSICWLRDYLLEKFKGLLIIISHDTSFLEEVSTDILDVDYGEIRLYKCGYSKFLLQKKETEEQKLKEKSFAEKKIERMRSFVDRFRAGTRSRQAASKEKSIERMEIPDLLKTSRIFPSFDLYPLRASGKSVLKVSGIEKSYGDKKVLKKLGFHLFRGDKTVIIGQNGIGKSTLLKIICGSVEPDSGFCEFGYEVKFSYFSQELYSNLKDDVSLLDWLKNEVPSEREEVIRKALGRVLFSGDEASKRVKILSGGEKARLFLAKIALEGANLLILDEPTNHLDIETKEALKKALKEYNGSVLLVTHDRDLASGVASRVIALSSKSMIDFKGGYFEYLEKYPIDYLSR